MSEAIKSPRNTSRRPAKARLGIDGYVRLLAYINSSPGTIPQIAAGFGIGRDTAYKVLCRFHACGWLHVSGWSQQKKRKALPIYSFGKGDDVPPPQTTLKGLPVASSVKPLAPTSVSSEVIGLCALLDELESECSMPELCAATGINKDTITKAVKAMAEHKLIHVAALHPRAPGVGGRYMKHWKLGKGPNATMPPREKRQRENARRYRQTRKTRQFTTSVVFALAGAANQAQAEQAA